MSKPILIGIDMWLINKGTIGVGMIGTADTRKCDCQRLCKLNPHLKQRSG